MRARRKSQAGLSLVELLVAMTILAIATTVALTLYDQARRSFKQGENTTEQQQIVRIAFDMMESDIRMAGFNANPDGNPARPDEAIEAAWPSAIILRADFDAEDPAEANVPEQTLGGAGSAFNTVSTGNDEIRAYVLAKPGAASGDLLQFAADVGQAVRDGSVEPVTIDNVALTHDSPPYTLYRMTLNNDAATCCSGGFVVRTPVVENVRSLRFRYYDHAGNELTPPGGAENPDSIATRGAIRRVGVEIEALTRDPDLHWFDTNDPDPATRSYRKFRLAGDVTPRNLGKAGIKDFQADLDPPSKPASPSLFDGHCGGLYISWPPNPPADEVAYYRILYGTDSLDLSSVRASHSLGAYIGGLADGVRYYVALEAVDRAGNRSNRSSVASLDTNNSNVPDQVVDLVASDDQTGGVQLAWSVVDENTLPTFGDPASPMVRDLAGYHVYRSEDPGFAPGPGDLIADATLVPNLPAPAFLDQTAVGCADYYYRTTAVDACGVEGEPSDPVPGSAIIDTDPRAPRDVGAFVAGTDLVRVQWTPVREDVDGNPIHIDTYNLFRSPLASWGTDDPSGFTFLTPVTGATEYLDSVVIPDGEILWYRVTAEDQCAPPNESAPSEHSRPDCPFPGRVVIQAPEYNDVVTGPTPVVVDIEGNTGTEIYEKLDLVFEYEADGTSYTYSIAQTTPIWNFNWNASPGVHGPSFYRPGPHRITARVFQRVNNVLCTASTSIRVVVD